MDVDYLTWYINLEEKLHHKKDTHLLMSSSTFEPTEMILNHLKQFQEIAGEHVDVSYAWGHQILKNEIAERYDVAFEKITTTNGASNGIYLTCRALLKKGDHVIIETPCYEPLRAAPAYIDAEISFLERKPPDYKIDMDRLKSLIRSDTRLIILTNLHNPSGAIIDNQTLIEIAKMAKAKNDRIKIIVDEIYYDFLPEIARPAAVLDDCFITLNSLTKVYGLGIIHCGWIIADRQTIVDIMKLQTLVEGAGSRLLDSFAAFIFKNLNQYHKRSLKLVNANLGILSQYMQPLIDKELIKGDIPAHGCIFFPGIAGLNDSNELVQRLADDYNIYIVPGKFFGNPEHVRIGFGGKIDLLKADLDRLTDALMQLL